MYLAFNIVGLVVFLALGWLLSNDRKNINWMSVGIMVGLNVLIAFVLTSFSGGIALVNACAAAFAGLVSVADQGISFVLGWWAVSPTSQVNFICSALLPILLVVPLFDTLTYIGLLPWVIKWIGRGLSFVTRQPKFETFFSVEMMFLGNTEALAVSKLQITKMSPQRCMTLAMMSMSCVTASIVAAYTQMVPGEFVLTAIPLNCINALIVSNMLFPVKVTPEEDVIYRLGDEGEEGQASVTSASKDDSNEVDPALGDNRAVGLRESPLAEEVLTDAMDEGMSEDSSPAAVPADGSDGVLARVRHMFSHGGKRREREPYFSFLGDSILGAGKLILIIMANVIAFVALAALIDKLLGAIWQPLSLESILGVVMYIPARLLGLDGGTAWDMSQLMGLKIVTNEFVAMGKVTTDIASYAPHYQAVLTVFLTSFANFGTLGMIIGCFKGMVGKEKNQLIASNVWRMLVAGILVSLLSAGMVGLFVW
jgi:purine nucleoside transport protein